LILSSLHWAFLRQRPQHVALKLVERGHSVVYFDTPEYVSSGVLLDKMRKNQLVEILKINANLSIVRLYLPEFRGIFAAIKNLIFKRAFKFALKQLAFHPNASIFYSLHFVPLIGILRSLNSKIAYDCVDDILSFPEFATSKYRAAEIELIKSSSACIATSRILCDKITRYSSTCVYLPNAMDFEHFNSSMKMLAFNTDPKVSALKHPVLGFIGAVFDWIDVDLICKLAQIHPDYSVLLVGPVDYGKEKLEAFANIVMVGKKPYESLPSYLSLIDVCLIPFKLNKITLASNPIKMYEYLAGGKPVVSTALPEVIRNASDIVAIGNDDSDFIAKVETAVKENIELKNNSIIERRLSFARNNSWESRVDVIEKLLNEMTSNQNY